MHEQYYDIPSLSVRNAVYSQMQADAAPFKASTCGCLAAAVRCMHVQIGAAAGVQLLV
jgi:hypothetical protein